MPTDSKPALLLLPGLMCDRTVWEAQMRDLADICNPLVMEWDAAHKSLPQMAEAALAVAPARFALAGHSMGGRVAFEVMRQAPDRVERLAVLNTGVTPLAEGDAGKQEESGRRRLLAMARESGMRVMAEEWLLGMLPGFRQGDRPLAEAIIQMFERRSADEFEIQMLALLGRPDARTVLPSIHCPTLVLTGQDDQWSPPARHREIAEAIAGAKLVLVPECGHMSTMERPAAISEAFRQWLS